MGIVESNIALQNVQPFMVSSILSDDGALEDNLSVYLFSLGLKEPWDAATLPFFFMNVWWLVKSFGLNELSKERVSVVVKLLRQLKPKDFSHSEFLSKGMRMDIDKELVIVSN